MSYVENLLSKLHKVKKTGPGRWVACCPSHGDRNPSLAIKDDGTKLMLRCFVGCSNFEIVADLGLDMSALYPPRDSSCGRPIKNPIPAADVLKCIQFEVLVVAVIASSISKGEELTKERKERLMLAVGRIQGAYEQ